MSGDYSTSTGGMSWRRLALSVLLFALFGLSLLGNFRVFVVVRDLPVDEQEQRQNTISTHAWQNDTASSTSKEHPSSPQQQDDNVLRIAHVLNVFASRPKDAPCPPNGLFCPLDQARNVTVASLERAVQASNKRVVIPTVYAAVFPEDAQAVPTNIVTLSKRLHRSTLTEYPNLKAKVSTEQQQHAEKKLPFLDDILASLYDSDNVQQGQEHYAFDYVIYTNSDIAVEADFYNIVADMIQKKSGDHKDIPVGLILNRRDDLPTKWRNAVAVTGNDLDELYPLRGIGHVGFDCFVFHREAYRNKFTMGDIFLGFPPIGLAMYQAVELSAKASSSNNFRVYKTFEKSGTTNYTSPTFHLGSEKVWEKGGSQQSPLWRQNIKNYEALVQKRFAPVRSQVQDNLRH